MAPWLATITLAGVLPHEGMLLGVWLSFFFFFFSFSGVKEQWGVPGLLEGARSATGGKPGTRADKKHRSHFGWHDGGFAQAAQDHFFCTLYPPGLDAAL